MISFNLSLFIIVTLLFLPFALPTISSAAHGANLAGQGKLI